MPRAARKIFGEPKLPWKNIMLVNNHDLKLSTLNVKSLTVKNTPLLKITIYPHPTINNHLLKSSRFLVLIGSHYWKNALRKKQTSIHREPILKCISSWTHVLPAKSIINISLLPTSALVPSHEIVIHLNQLFQKKILFDRRPLPVNDESQQDKRMGLVEYFNCFGCLFPFSYHRWLEFMVKRNIYKNFSNFYGTYTSQVKINSRGMWIMTHHYQIDNCKDPTNLHLDLNDFLKMLKKFNFLLYFNERIISTASRKKAEAISQRLIRVLKWRSLESERYLIFLIRTFRHQDFIIILQDFVNIYDAFLKQAMTNKR